MLRSHSWGVEETGFEPRPEGKALDVVLNQGLEGWEGGQALVLEGRQDLPGHPLPLPEAKPTDSGQGPRAVSCRPCPITALGVNDYIVPLIKNRKEEEVAFNQAPSPSPAES